jgi:hypothetical protein
MRMCFQYVNLRFDLKQMTMPISPLAQKLRIKPGQSLLLLNAPSTFVQMLGELADNKIETENVSGKAGYLHLFVKNSTELEHWFPIALHSFSEDTVFWISYPKQTAKFKTDLNRDKGWEHIFNAGYRPVSAVAIDEDWTALRFRKGTFNRATQPADKSARMVILPDDFRNALSAKADVLGLFEKLAYSHRKEYVQWIEGAKKPETRERRIKQAVEKLAEGKKLS